jgi:hypothetical protein
MTNPCRRLEPDEFEIAMDGQPRAAILRWPDHMDLAGRIISGDLTIAHAMEILAGREAKGY